MSNSRATAFLVVLLLVITSLAAAERPNVVLFLADDMGLGDTSAYQDFTGNADDVQIDTPAMERLARMGLRFTDAHTPASRCTPTRYALLTGRYAWRSRMKHWVLFGSQGDPLIEKGRPTIASLLRDEGYRTGMVGKWHVGLRYRQSDGRPAAGWDDADLRQPMFDTPLGHGFDFCRFTSRSHGTSGPDAGAKGMQRRNGPKQSIGPGHVHGREIVAATDDGKRLEAKGPNAYVLSDLGGRHSDNAISFLDEHVTGKATRSKPFLLYYPSNSNHGPYTPDTHVGDVSVKGAARTKSGKPMNARGDFVYENDVALGRLIDYLAAHDDPRRPGSKLIDNTIVIFTSDNGAERDDNVNTGPFRSHKGSCYEGGHRVPFLVAWPAGGVGDGDGETPGKTCDELIGLHDLFATFAEAAGAELPDVCAGEIGGEDSTSVLAAWRGKSLPNRPMFYHDHKQAKDPAVAAMRLDDPVVGGKVVPGQWKIFFDASLLRAGTANPTELYDLATDSMETKNRLADLALKPLVEHLSETALRHRTAGSHQLADLGWGRRIVFDFTSAKRDFDSHPRLVGFRKFMDEASTQGVGVVDEPWKRLGRFELNIRGLRNGKDWADGKFTVTEDGLGMTGGESDAFDDGEGLLLYFNRDVIVESVAIVAGDGTCGGTLKVGPDRSPVAIYCVDADIDAKDQSGVLSDVGVVGQSVALRLETRPHLGVESPGRWRVRSISVRMPSIAEMCLKPGDR